MYFSHYLKACRKQFSLTQEELVSHFYQKDEVFSNLDVVTLSRWERGINRPNVQRQKSVIQALQTYSNNLFPCFDSIDMQQIEAKLSHIGIQNIIGKHKRFIMNFPCEIIEKDEIEIINIKAMEEVDLYIDIAYSILSKMTNNYLELDTKVFKQWASHPDSFFLFAIYKDQFFGMLFSLRIKAKIFEKLINFELLEKDIKEEHFASKNEEACDYPLSFFAYTQQSASLLILRYYSYLVKEQKHIQEVGCFPKTLEGEAFVKTLGLQSHKKHTHKKIITHSFKAPIQEVLVNPYILTILFKEEKGEEI